jgi:hypothetical protein
MIMKNTITTVLGLMFAVSALADVPLSYTGRLVNLNGSPVSGPVNLKLELARTDGALPPTVLCTQTISSVPLTNGVFHLKIDLTNSQCGGIPVSKVLAETPPGEAAAIRVTDVTNSKVYSFQAIHAIPFSSVSYYAKSLAQMGAVAGQVLSWNGTQWAPASAGGAGSVSSVATGAGLTGGPITASGTISVATGGITAAMLAQMGASLGNTLKWNGSAWAPSPDAGITSESDPTVQGWAKNTILVCTTAQTLRYDALLNSGAGGLYCSNLALSSDAIAEGSTNLYYTDTRAKTAAVANALVDGVNDVAPSQNSVFDALALKQNTLSSSTNITVGSLQSSAALNGSSGVEYGARLTPTVNQSSTAGYTGLLLNVSETATGSGLKKLLDLQVGGVSKFSVDSNGSVTSGTSTQGTTANYTSAGGNQFVVGYDATNKTTVNVDTLGFTTFSSTGTAAGFNFTGGNVGIGTSVPAEKLEVAGTIRSGSINATGGSIMLVDNYSPGHLSVFGTEYSSGGPFIGYGVNPGSAAPETFVSSTPSPLARTALNTGVDFRFFTAASQTVATGAPITLVERMRITNLGSVGIGTSTPKEALDVNSGAIRSAIGNGSLAVHGGRLYLGLTQDTTTYNQTYISAYTTFSGNDGSGSGSTGGLIFATKDTTGASIASERMRISANGKIGIGTDTPTAKLESSSTTEQLRLSYNTSANARFTVNASGDLNITSSSGKTSLNNGMGGFELGGINNRGSLQIINRASSAWIPFATINTSYPENVYDLQNVGTINTYYIGIQQPTPAAYLDIGMRNNNSPNSVSAIFSRGADNNFQMFAGSGIDTNDVGGLIGKFGSRYSTTGDNAVVNFYRGAGSTDGKIGLSTAGVDRLTVKADGNVGIGITNPTEMLEVSGTVKATNFVGNFALKSATIPPDNNWYKVASGNGQWCGFDYRTDTPASNSPSFSRGSIKVINDNNNMAIDVASSQYGPNTNVQFARSGNSGQPGVVWVRNLGSYDANFTITDAKNCIVALDGTNATNPPSGSGQVIFSQLPGNSTYTNSNSVTLGSIGIGTTSPEQKLHVSVPSGGVASRVSSGSVAVDTYVDSVAGIALAGTSSAHPLGLQTSGQERVLIDASGNVGIGSASPINKLDVVGKGRFGLNLDSISPSPLSGISNTLELASPVGSNPPAMSFHHRDKHSLYLHTFGTTFTSQGFRMISPPNEPEAQLQVQGYVGIGTTDPKARLHVSDSEVSTSKVLAILNNSPASLATGDLAQLQFRLFNDGQPTGRIFTEVVSTSDLTSKLHFGTRYGNGTNYTNTDMTLAGGRLGIGNTNPSERLHVAGNVEVSGSVRASGSVLTSDSRLKKSITPLSGALAKILQLKGYSYHWKDQKRFTPKKQIGLIAQEVQMVYPEAVSKGPDGFLAVSYSHLLAPVIEAIKELSQNFSDESRHRDQEIAALKRENAIMKARLERLEKAVEVKK